MGAGQATAGRPLGATVEVRLQRHGASGRGTVSKRHCSNSFFFFIIIIIIIIYIFFYLWGPKNELQQMPPLYNAYGAAWVLRSKFYKDKQN